VLHRDTGALEHCVFRDIGGYLQPGDLLVRNDSRVVAARLHGRRAGTGGKVQALLLRQSAGGAWEALVKPASRIRLGDVIEFDPAGGGPAVAATVEERLAEGTRLLRFPEGVAPQNLGETPLPPYITAPLQSPERYQTVYAREEGSAAAPTAGLHFTQRLLDELTAKGVQVVSVTLHVGLDTFRPVRHDDPREHGIHQEYYTLANDAAAQITQAAHEGRRIFAVGTTSVRSLEDAARRSGWTPERARTEQPPLRPYTGPTSLYLLPGSPFLAVDAMITNFHVPRTTLLMLVSAFAGRERILHTYAEAVRLRYRFYSFGDALLLI
jgi:S-adenosylmethionine:tRNA ribosyltransferase-isomerase